MFGKVLNSPLHMNEDKKTLTLWKTLKTPNFKGQNETEIEKDHIIRKINIKKNYLWSQFYYYFNLTKIVTGMAHTAKN